MLQEASEETPVEPVPQPQEEQPQEEQQPEVPVVPEANPEDIAAETFSGQPEPLALVNHSVEWANYVATKANDLDRLIRGADKFITVNQDLFGEFAPQQFGDALKMMGKVSMDTKSVSADAAHFAKGVKSKLGDAVDYLDMIEAGDGETPSEDDMEILSMVMGSFKDALVYSDKKVTSIRGSF